MNELSKEDAQFEAKQAKKVKMMNLQRERKKIKLQCEAWRRNSNGKKRL